MSQEPEVTRFGVVDMQVCVPADWDDAKVTAFANEKNPSGLEAGWTIRTDPKLLAGAPVRNPCKAREGFVHLMLDC